MPQLRQLLAVLCVALFVVAIGCGKKDKNKSKSKKDKAATECTSDKECGGPPNLCVQGKCARPGTKGVITNPGAMSPEAMKKEIQKRANERQKKLDKSLDMDK